ncbi:site-specific integrase [Parasphingopyxis sp.]|uniref:tyrosine-type recombinase/integrase n=1 Tax=Parasphingopyxis sp. TaxID=1920299 RepID=UPI00261012B5|nr:site-specific integrase [Parasphingopyxis sp.]
MTKHTILGGKVHLYQRERSSRWQCSTYLNGKNHRASTKEDSLARAKDFAEDWYLELRGKQHRGELTNEKTFRDAAKKFVAESAAILAEERSHKWLRDHESRIRLHLNPYFGKEPLSEVTSGKVQDYRAHRLQSDRPPSRSTLHSEIVTLRQVMKTAQRHGWIKHLPDFSAPYKTNGKITHRGWFSHDEYKQLYEATRKYAREQRGKQHQWNAEQLHDKVLFLANTGIRPDEANGLQYRDVEIVVDDATGETILEIEVRGKRGVGYCKSTTGAVRPFERMVERNQPEPTDRLFPVDHKKKFNQILDELGLKIDRLGNRRTLYSLRHSYISFRLLEGADIYQIAKNCRTSVEMIEKHYAVHLKNSLDAAAINVRRSRNE